MILITLILLNVIMPKQASIDSSYQICTIVKEASEYFPLDVEHKYYYAAVDSVLICLISDKSLPNIEKSCEFKAVEVGDTYCLFLKFSKCLPTTKDTNYFEWHDTKYPFGVIASLWGMLDEDIGNEMLMTYRHNISEKYYRFITFFTTPNINGGYIRRQLLIDKEELINN